MSVMQIAFEIPPEIQQGLLNGTLVRFGGIVRDSAGHIVAHLKEVPVPKADSELKKVSTFMKKNKNPIIIISVTAAALAVAGFSYVIVKNKNKEENVPACIVNFNEAFTNYVNAIKEGNLTEETIDTLLKSIDELKQNEESGNITITIPVENSELLIDMIKSYTEKFAAANNYTFELNSEVNTDIEQIKRYLSIQKEVFQHSV